MEQAKKEGLAKKGPPNREDSKKMALQQDCRAFKKPSKSRFF
jgi:hypothetical protein